MPPVKCLFETLEGSLAPDVISPEPVDGLKKFKRHLKAEKICINCIELIFGFCLREFCFQF